MPSLSAISTVLLAVLAATATAAPANKRQETLCKVEAIASHSYGGGGPGQGTVNYYTYGINCYDAAGNFHWQDDQYKGDTAGINAADCGTQQNIFISTVYDGASNHFSFCGANYNGQDVTGEESDHIGSGTVSVSTSTCTYYFTC